MSILSEIFSYSREGRGEFIIPESRLGEFLDAVRGWPSPPSEVGLRAGRYLYFGVRLVVDGQFPPMWD